MCIRDRAIRTDKILEYLNSISSESPYYNDKLELEGKVDKLMGRGKYAPQPESDSSILVKAKRKWKEYSAYNPERREEEANKYLEKISPDSPFYEERLAFEKEISDYFDYCQPIANERYSYYVNNLSGSKSYKNLLRKLVNFGFVQENFFAKEGNMFYDYALLEYEGMVKIVVQVKINYANDISYDVFTYCY